MIRRSVLSTIVVVAAMALAVACTQAASPTPTASGVAPGVGAPTGGLGVPTGGVVAPAPGASQPQTAGYSSYVAPQPAYGTQQTGIWVSGSGKVVVTPDLVLLSLGVEARAKTVQQARDQAAAAMTKVMETLKNAKIADKDIRTQYFNIQPEYVWNDFAKRQEITGYRVSNSISVKVRDLPGVGILVDQVANAGGDLVRIDNISFTVEQPERYAEQAREAAVKDAMAKAQQFAKLTGNALGKLVYITESGANVPLVRDYAEAKVLSAGAPGVAPTTPISGGEMEVTVYVQAVWGIG